MDGKKTRRGLAPILALGGSAMALVGVFLGRGMEQGMLLIQARLFLLVVGFSLALAGIIGLVAQARSRRAGKKSGDRL